MPPPYTNLYDRTTRCYCLDYKSFNQSDSVKRSHKRGQIVKSYSSSIIFTSIVQLYPYHPYA